MKRRTCTTSPLGQVLAMVRRSISADRVTGRNFSRCRALAVCGSAGTSSTSLAVVEMAAATIADLPGRRSPPASLPAQQHSRHPLRWSSENSYWL